MVRTAPGHWSVLLLVASLLPAVATAAGWRVDPAASRLNFVSVKNGAVGETHTFTRLSGTVDAAGLAQLVIELDSVDTGVEIRDQRMREMLFDTVKFPQAKVTAAVDHARLGGLEPGQRLRLPVTLTLELHGRNAEIPAELAVTALTGGRLQVATSGPVMVDATAFALGDGVEALRSVVNLKSIAVAVPVTAELVLEPAAP